MYAHYTLISTLIWLLTTLNLSAAKPSLEQYVVASDYMLKMAKDE
jgi:hypothetical protein